MLTFREQPSSVVIRLTDNMNPCGSGTTDSYWELIISVPYHFGEPSFNLLYERAYARSKTQQAFTKG